MSVQPASRICDVNGHRLQAVRLSAAAGQPLKESTMPPSDVPWPLLHTVAALADAPSDPDSGAAA